MSLQDGENSLKKRKAEDEEEVSKKRLDDSHHSRDAVREAEVGIEEYVSKDLSPIEGGIIKQRYSDFHVKEVDRHGNICHISSLWPAKNDQGGSGLLERLEEQRLQVKVASRVEPDVEEAVEPESEVREWNVEGEQMDTLREMFDSDSLEQLRQLWMDGPVKGRDTRAVTTHVIESKEKRTSLHQLIRQISQGRLASDTLPSQDNTGTVIKIRWGSGKPQKNAVAKQNPTAPVREPTQTTLKPYIHFLLQKTNRDSQDALNILSRSLGLWTRSGGPSNSQAGKDLTVAGTKDKRGITVQQVALKRGRRTLDEVWRSANGLRRHGRDDERDRREALAVLKKRADRGVRIAHLKYADTPLRLGELRGNAFGIVLRSIKLRDRRTIDKAFEVLKSKGFINYFGMQRFGTSVISTHTVGIAVLRNDYRTAIELIVAPRQGDPDGVKQARQAYEAGRLREAYELFPHFNVPERSILQRMRDDRTSPFKEGVRPSTYESADWRKYFSALPRTLRTMYVHAFQSYVWNKIASERVRRFGLDTVQVGDVVGLGSDEWLEMDEGGDDGSNDDDTRANAVDFSAPGLPWHRKVKTIESEEEAQRYTIHDVMIAMPGTHVQLPSNSWAEEAYRKILAQDGLTHEDILAAAKRSPELSLTGDYRKLLHLPKDVSYELVRYADPNVNLIQSDEDKLLGLDVVPTQIPFVDENDATAKESPFVALIVHLTLGVSAYATMALREILKQETSSAHQRELTMKGEDRKEM